MSAAAKTSARKTNSKTSAPKPKAPSRPPGAAKPRAASRPPAAPKPNTAKKAPVRATTVAPVSAPVSDHAAVAMPPKAKGKRVHGKFSMPKADYALIDALKKSAKKAGRPVKKNELLRAGLRALSSLDPVSLRLALASVQPADKPAKKK